LADGIRLGRGGAATSAAQPSLSGRVRHYLRMDLLVPEYQTLLFFLRRIWLCKRRDSFANLPRNDTSRKQSKKSCLILLLFDSNCSAQQRLPNQHGDSKHAFLRCCWHDAGLLWPAKMTVQTSLAGELPWLSPDSTIKSFHQKAWPSARQGAAADLEQLGLPAKCTSPQGTGLVYRTYKVSGK